MKRRIVTATIALLLTIPAPAQTNGTMPYLLVSPSPWNGALGQAGVAVPTTDPFAAFHNPAHSGYAGERANASVAFVIPGRTRYPGVHGRASFDHHAAAFGAGYNLSRRWPHLPVSLGFAFYRSRIDFGPQRTISSASGDAIRFDAHETVTAGTFGLGYHHARFQAYAGLTAKSARSDLPLQTGEDVASGSVNPVDLGMLLVVPVHRFWRDGDAEGSRLRVSFGYALANAGDDVESNGFTSFFPTPREARLGYALEWTWPQMVNGVEVDGLSFLWTLEAVDELVRPVAERRATGDAFQGPLGDIGLLSNVLAGRHDERVGVRYGAQVAILEMLAFRWGAWRGPLQPAAATPWTMGVTVSSAGLLPLVTGAHANGWAGRVAAHLSLRYHVVRWDYGRVADAVTRHGVSVVVAGW